MNPSHRPEEPAVNAHVSAPARRRYAEFDILRSISMFLMVVAHTWEQFYSFIHPSVVEQNSWFTYTYAIIGPSVLMMCLGTNLAFSRSKAPGKLAMRGVLFIGIDIVLNILRFGLPAFVFAICGNPVYLPFFWENLLASDIYAFVGALFILYALFEKWNLRPAGIVVLAVGMLTLNTLLDLLHLNLGDHQMLKAFVGRFFWMGHTSYFSLFPWFIFPAIGCYFGTVFKKHTGQAQSDLVRRLLWLCVIGFVALSAALISHGVSPRIAVISLNDYKIDLLSVLLMVFLGGISFAFAHLYVVKHSASVFTKACMKVSKVIMPFYVIQWIVIGWLQFIFEAAQLYGMFQSLLSVYLTALAIILVSLFLAFQFDKAKTARARAAAQKTQA